MIRSFSHTKIQYVKISIVSKTAVLLTNPYVKKCFSREFVSKVPLFHTQSPTEITNRKLGVSSEMGKLTFVYIDSLYTLRPPNFG
ncbi:hypothetical protein M2137_002348 [Parabacteroides sp. PFB2-10]|nr:hypothetical protein [Parabacteroides sp. PFB2-10]